MPTEWKAPDNDRRDAVLVTHADGTTELLEMPEELKAGPVEISLSQETIDALGAAMACPASAVAEVLEALTV
jgi:hypothetical protein